MCPTTERDLADGIGPARALVDAGSPLCLGSDSHAVIDLLEEARAVELNERLRDRAPGPLRRRPTCSRAATADGHAALGWTDAGRARGRRARRPGHRAPRHRPHGGLDPATWPPPSYSRPRPADVTRTWWSTGVRSFATATHLLVADVAPRALPAGDLGGLAMEAVWP